MLDVKKVKLFMTAGTCGFLLLLPKQILAKTVHLGLKINYKTAMSHVDKDNISVVNDINTVSAKFPKSRLLISGHTDTVGSYEVNVELSKGRAEILKLLLEKNGLDPDRVETKWFSYDAPIASNDTPEGRAKNRRSVASFYGLTTNEVEELLAFINSSQSFYLIEVENEQVDEYVEKTLDPQRLEEAVIEPEPRIEAKVEETIEPVESPKLEVTQAPAVKPKNQSPSLYRYSLGVGSYQNDLSLKSKTIGPDAEWISRFNSVVLGSIQKKLGSVWVGFGGSVHLQDFRQHNHPSYSWEKTRPLLIKGSVITDYELQKFHFGFDIDFAQETFWHEEATNVELKNILMGGVTGRIQYTWLQNDTWSSKAGIRLEMPLLGSDSIKPEGTLGYVGHLDFTQHNDSGSKYNFSFYYGVRNLETVRVNQQEQVVGINFKYMSKYWP